ncbi:beta-galactosidase [Acidiphilium sp. PA]|uniref:beta-galactosidase n=1 Tax=Acidiphilium sp. PA TaxID=2871705 RepID=UPI002243926C|nr:beta-galactosidase [Acidiphilium sp. PA]MCW8306449.1 beta-galactosidase [Acidiphilium sp. PA]
MLSRRSLLALIGLGATAPAARGGPEQHVWPEWQAIIYQHQNDAQLDTLQRIGVTNGKIFTSRDDAAGDPANPQAAAFARRGMRFYVENIATDFYSAYHRWFPDRPVDAAFLAVQAWHRRHPNDPAAFIRNPGLSDPVWLARITGRLGRVVRDYARYRPLYYSLADEPGIADLAANWDFDLAPSSLAGMRAWLKTQYPSLAALNHQWETDFASWDAVTPVLTDVAVRQFSHNFSGWADFKRWMDVAFARAVRAGTEAVHAADPGALAAIEGAQIPGWGGYNYTHLARAVDVMEIYDGDENIEIARSLNPSLIMLLTIAGADPAQRHQLWRSVLRGMRGAILWDPSSAMVLADGTPGPWAVQAAPVFAALRGPLGRTLLAAERIDDGIATLYSPASLRTQWLLDRRGDWSRWENRGPSVEIASDDPVRAAMRGFATLIDRAGFQGHYTAPGLIEQGVLASGRIRLLFMPHVIALSDLAAVSIRRFVSGGGIVVADVVPGAFDEHSRVRERPVLADLFEAGGRAIIQSPSGDRAAAVFARAGLDAPFRVERTDGQAGDDVRLFRFRHRGATLLAMHRSFAAGGIVEPFTLHLASAAATTDLRSGAKTGPVRRLDLTLDPVTPTVLRVG